MEHRNFAAKARNELGKGAVGRLRKAGRLPAVVYGGNKLPESISLDADAYSREHKNLTESTLVTLNIDGKEKTVFVKDAQYDIISGRVLHVDFYEVEKGKAVRTHVSIHIFGNPEGVRAGGILENPTHMIEVECDPSLLPERLDVDVSKLNVNQSIHVKDLALDPRIKIISSTDTVVALVKFAKAEASTTTETAAAAAPTEAAKTETPAAGGAKPAAKA